MAFTATKDVPLAATTTGSWPRPAWYTQSLWGRPLDTAMLDPIYREQFSDALALVVSDQERAGLDIVTCGDYFLDADLAGRSWHHYPLQRWRGVAFDELQPEDTRSDLLTAGTLLNEIYTSWRWPIVTGKIEHNPRNPLEYAKIYRMTQARTRKPVKFGNRIGSSHGAVSRFSHTPEYRIDDNKKQMIWDMATAINRELRELVASGCSVIQIEEPTIHFIACYYPDATDTLIFLTDALNHELSGLEKAEVWIDTCWGNPMMQRVFDKTSYANALEIYLDRIKCDVLTLEMRTALAEIELLGAWKGKTKKKFAIGVVSHRTLNADTPVEVANEIRKALKYIDIENLVVTSDCGFGRQGANRLIAFYKTAATAQGANIIRREHGLPETYVPCADPRLSQDRVPESFEE